MALLFKNTVQFPTHLSPIYLLLQVAKDVFEERGYDCVVTSWLDGQHSRTSLHWVGHAVDLRTKAQGIGLDEAREIAEDISKRLPPNQFDVLAEDDHIHGEWQPKR